MLGEKVPDCLNAADIGDLSEEVAEPLERLASVKA